MKTLLFWSLVVANVLLGAALLSRFTGGGVAIAQQNQPRRPGDYIMIPGEVTGGSNAVVYVIDTTNGTLGAISFDDSNKQLNGMEPIDLGRLFAENSAGDNATDRRARRRTGNP